MQRLTLLALIASGLFSVSCGEPHRAAAPDLSPRHSEQLECEINPDRCARIRAGIDHLLMHTYEVCQEAGRSAQNRFFAPPGEGFKSGNRCGDNCMYVHMHTEGGQWVPSDGYINAAESIWDHPSSEDPVHMGALVAHEEYAHQGGLEGPDHASGIGESIQDLCGGYAQ